MKCDQHKNGCGRTLKTCMTVVVDATECELVEGKIYYIAARVVTDDARKSCKIGIVKCLFDQVHLFAHRVGIVTEIHCPDKNQSTTKRPAYIARNKCFGTATLKFIDGGLLQFDGATTTKNKGD